MYLPLILGIVLNGYMTAIFFLNFDVLGGIDFGGQVDCGCIGVSGSEVVGVIGRHGGLGNNYKRVLAAVQRKS